MSKYIIQLKFHHLKKKKKLFLLIPYHPASQDNEEFKMGASLPLPSGAQGEREGGEN